MWTNQESSVVCLMCVNCFEHAYKVNKDDGENAGKDINLVFTSVFLTVQFYEVSECSGFPLEMQLLVTQCSLHTGTSKTGCGSPEKVISRSHPPEINISSKVKFGFLTVCSQDTLTLMKWKEVNGAACLLFCIRDQKSL